MKRLLLLTLYLLLSITLTSAAEETSKKSSPKPTPSAEADPPPTEKSTKSSGGGGGNTPSGSDGVVAKRVGWNYKTSTLALACVIIGPKKRKDSKWQEGLTKRIDSLRYDKESKSPIGYTSQSHALGVIYYCFQATYGDFLEVIRTHGEGARFIDYSRIYQHKFPKPKDNDQYSGPKTSGPEKSKQKPMGNKHKRSISPSTYQSPVRSLRRRTNDLMSRGASGFQKFKRFARRGDTFDHGTYHYKRQDGTPGKKDDNPEVQDDKPEVTDDKLEVKDGGPEIKDDKPETQDDVPEIQDDKPETKDDKTEVKDDKPEIKGDKPETKDDKPEIKDDKPATNDDSSASLRRSKDFTQDTAVFSTEPPGLDLEDEYIFDADDGRKATVYIIDGGVNTNHSAFSWKDKKDPKNIGWIWAGPRPSDRQADHSPNPLETSVRGTHVASKVIGAVTGLARLASTYMVVPYDSDGGLNILTYLDALVKMHDHVKITSEKQPDKKIVLCFSHPVVHVARSQEFIHWTQYTNMTQSKKEFMNAATSILDEILEDFGKMKNVVMVTRATGLLLDKDPDPMLNWPARRANTGNVTNLVVIGGVKNNGIKIMQAPDSVVVYAPAQDIRVPILHRTNLDAYTTIPYSIRLSVGSVSGLLASFMSKYNEDGRAAKNRLEANAYPRTKFGYSVVWNGLRVPSCGLKTSTPKLKKRVPSIANVHYTEGIVVKCELSLFRAEIVKVKTKVNGSETEVPEVKYFHAADGPGYTHKIPPVPKPTIYRPSFAVTITSTTSVGVGRFSSDYEHYKDMLRSGRPPGPAGAKPGLVYDEHDTAPMMTTDKYGRTGEVLVIWKTVYTSAEPAGTATTATSTTASVKMVSTLSEPTGYVSSKSGSSLPVETGTIASSTMAKVVSTESKSGTQTVDLSSSQSTAVSISSSVEGTKTTISSFVEAGTKTTISSSVEGTKTISSRPSGIEDTKATVASASIT
ncbi:hypothetical protein TWF481_006734 [Arthrobotrys musiformis]|uniref:Peptidase S8/S53 domain-containing protein n=1 Tax=Arthrobotrys musiformis TaxID=47236 RepID=A0AAV9W9D6_9PEZI